MNNLPLLVTGAHRTGTTWVGRMLAADKSTSYISEPLNVLHRPGVFRAKVNRWYQYICEENEAEYLPAFNDLLNFRYDLFNEILSLRSARDFMRMGRDAATFYNGKLRRQRALLKDPFAIFSLPWFAKRLNARIVVTVRHPAAFASSLKRLNWTFDFSDLLAQPLLMRDHLEPYREQMQTTKADDVIGQASLLWDMIYRTLHSTRQLIPNLLTVRHEDLSLDPTQGFRDLYTSLGLDFTPHVEQTILTSSSSENPQELTHNKTHSTKLDSRANIDNWKKRLTPEEIHRITETTSKTIQLYYPNL